MTADEGPRGDTIEFKAEPRTIRKRRQFPIFAILASAVLISTGGGAYYAWKALSTDNEVREVPLIRAQPGPIKVKPETAGGMDIPDQDKTVFDRMEGEGERPGVEQLLPPPEAPRTPPWSRSETARVPDAAAPAARTPDAARQAGQPSPAPMGTASVPAPPPPVAAPAAPVETASTGTSRGGYLIQLAAARSEDTAKAEWDRLKRTYGDVLGRLDLSVMRVDLGPDRGIFFRVRAGPIADEAAARAACAALVERKQGCLVVRPEG